VVSAFISVWIFVWTGFAVIFVIAAFFEAGDSDNGLLGAIILACLSGMLAGSGVVVARVRRGSQAPRVQAADPAPAPPRRRLPGKKSAAREPMERLAEAEAALRDLMAQLSGSAAGPSVPRDVVDHTSRIAAETAGRLRAIAAKVEALEAAIKQAPDDRRAGLEDGALSLLGHLDRGLEGYRELMAAAGHLVLAGTQDPVPDELIEATDHLAGLASALRDLSGGPEIS
jgi:hypothetical protein